MFKEILKNEWISSNGKWKVSVRVQKQTLADGSQPIIVSDINVKSFVRDNVWRSENQNKKLPKYVQSELDKAWELVKKARENGLLVLQEMTMTTVD